MEIIVGIVATILLGLIAVVWNMLNDKINSNREECEERDQRLWDQIGRDSYSGMRKMVHGMEGNTQALIDLDRRVDRLEGKP